MSVLFKTGRQQRSVYKWTRLSLSIHLESDSLNIGAGTVSDRLVGKMKYIFYVQYLLSVNLTVPETINSLKPSGYYMYHLL
jgi:hypothetical protein